MSFWRRLFGLDNSPKNQPTQPQPAPEQDALFTSGPPEATPEPQRRFVPEDTQDHLAGSTVAGSEPTAENPYAAPPTDREVEEDHVGSPVAGMSVDEVAEAEPLAEPVEDTMTETPSTALTDSDISLIDACVTTLESVGIVPQDGIEKEDIEDALADDLEYFRRRPLTSTIAASDPSGERIFRRVYVDSSDVERNSIDSLQEYLEEVAIAAETDGDIHDIVVFPDRGTESAGSIRFRVGDWDVHDVSFDFDDELAGVDADITFPKAVAQPGLQAYRFEGAVHANPLIVWVDPQQAEATSFVSAIQAELESPVHERA